MASCDAFLQFVTSSDVRELKTRLDPPARAIDAAAAACAALKPATRAAWKDFYAGWRAYADAPESFWSAAAEYNAGCEHEAQIAAWKDTIDGAGCAVPGPNVLPPDRPPGSMQVVRAIAIASAVAIGLVAVAYVARPFVDVAASAMRSRSRANPSAGASRLRAARRARLARVGA